MKLIGLLCLALLLASCGQTVPNNGSTLDKETALALKNSVLKSHESLIDMFPNGGIKTLATDGCLKIEGDATDADGDAIPANVTFILNNCVFREGDVETIVSGPWDVKDQDDSDPASGFSGSKDWEVTETSGGKTEMAKLVENLTLNVAKDKSKYEADGSLKIDSATADESYSANLKASYTPENPKEPFRSGTFIFNNSVRFTSKGKSESISGESLPDEHLHYSADCNSGKGGFDRGRVRYKYNQSIIIEISFDNECLENVNLPLLE